MVNTNAPNVGFYAVVNTLLTTDHLSKHDDFESAAPSKLPAPY